MDDYGEEGMVPYLSEEQKAEFFKNNNGQVGIISSSACEYLETTLKKNRIKKGTPLHCKTIKAFNNRDDWGKLKTFLSNTHILFQSYSAVGIVYTAEDNFIKFDIDQNTINFAIFGDSDYVEEQDRKINEYMEVCNYHMKWVYDLHGSHLTIPIKHDNLPVPEMYPFLEGKTLDQYYEEFITSSSNTLLLLGPPGTGKTSFIKGLLNYAESSAIVSYNPQVFTDDSFFVDFLRSSTKFMIMEDCDKFLEPRSDGNNMMHTFLNVSDGLVTIKGKKLIFTTNLSSVQKIDEALLRPGRCFDTIKFDELTKSQAQNLAKTKNLELKNDKDSYTIAEIFCGEEQVIKKENNDNEGRIGFRA